jgi:hypothetical protein
MSIDGQESKAQHYVPNFYLKGFTDRNGSLWVYEKSQPPRQSKPKHEAHRPDYYTHTDTGERDESIEDLLEKVESQVGGWRRHKHRDEFWVPHPSILRVRFLIFPGVRSIKSWRVARLLASRRESASIHRRATATNELASDPTQSSAVPLPQARPANVVEPRRSACQLPLR